MQPSTMSIMMRMLYDITFVIAYQTLFIPTTIRIILTNMQYCLFTVMENRDSGVADVEIDHQQCMDHVHMHG